MGSQFDSSTFFSQLYSLHKIIEYNNNNKNTCEKHTMNPASYTGWTCHGGRVETVHQLTLASRTGESSGFHWHLK